LFPRSLTVYLFRRCRDRLYRMCMSLIFSYASYLIFFSSYILVVAHAQQFCLPWNILYDCQVLLQFSLGNVCFVCLCSIIVLMHTPRLNLRNWYRHRYAWPAPMSFPMTRPQGANSGHSNSSPHTRLPGTTSGDLSVHKRTQSGDIPGIPGVRLVFFICFHE